MKLQMEENRLRYVVAATNPALYLKLFSQTTEGDVEWHTPQSAEEIDEFLAILKETRRGSDQIDSEPLISETT